MQFLLHRSPFRRQGQIRDGDGEHDTLSALVVFLPQEQPYNFIDISESVKHDNIIDDCAQVQPVRWCNSLSSNSHKSVSGC